MAMIGSRPDPTPSPPKSNTKLKEYAFEILKATVQSGRVDTSNHEYAVTNAIKLAERFISEIEGK